MAFNLKSIFGDSDSRYVNSLKPIVRKINDLEKEFEGLIDSDLPRKTILFKERLAKGETLDDILPEAFALVREAAKRTLKQRHYDVQLIGGIILHERKIAEMRTGEGKTLVATLPAYLNALEGKGVHIVTVNDYLANRDTVWMGKIYNALGLSVGVINDQNNSFLFQPEHEEENKEEDKLGSFKVVHEHLRPCGRREAYAADITYGTNHQFGFDYLRDNLAPDLEHVVQRGFHFAIIDEIDSILIDEARTPLIISSESEESEDLYLKFADIASKLEKDSDFTVEEKHKSIALTDQGINRAEDLLGISNIYTEKGIKYVHHLETAVRAKAIFIRDKDYIVRDGEVMIVDPFTGRVMPGRRWSEGLHQAIEAKEGVKIQKETRAVASITFQNYFRLYEKYSGMTGTAKTSEEEFRKVYGLPVVSIPTNKPSGRSDHNDQIFQTEKGKWIAIVRKVKELQEKGQPVLIGTVSIEKNELLSAYLNQEGISHVILNAKNHEHEGEIIADAGRRNRVTIATNMAGRGVDIKLGGVEASEEEAEEIKKSGGLFVLGTERHEARRIDNQLRGRAGRQGDPGETQFFVSLEDDLMRVFGSEGIKKMMGRFGIPEDFPIENRFVSKAIESAQGKIEGFNFDARKYTLEYDDIMNYQRQLVYSRRMKMLAGGDPLTNQELPRLVPSSVNETNLNRGKEYIQEFLDKILIGRDDMQSVVEEKKKLVGEENFFELARRIILYVNDILWMEHIETMEYLRESVNLRAYGQRDPLVEYKKEGLKLFKDMEFSLGERVLELIKNINVAPPVEAKVEKKYEEEHKEAGQFEKDKYHESKTNTANTANYASKEKIGRNDPCPCGAINPETGQVYKYKKCGLINAPYHKK